MKVYTAFSEAVEVRVGDHICYANFGDSVDAPPEVSGTVTAVAPGWIALGDNRGFAPVKAVDIQVMHPNVRD